jgi:hypothetical protein
MSTAAKGKFEIEGWDEDAYEEREGGAKLSRADVKASFAGDIEGESSVVFLMSYRADDTADFVGLQNITGTLDGREGSFVVSAKGTFDGKEAKGDWDVVAGSGSGELEGLTGSGGFSAPLGSTAEFNLDYDLG